MTPDLNQQLSTIECSTRMRFEKLEQPSFDRAHRGEIWGLRVGTGPDAQDGDNASNDFGQRKWLGNQIIGADAPTADDMLFFGQRRQDDQPHRMGITRGSRALDYVQRGVSWQAP